MEFRKTITALSLGLLLAGSSGIAIAQDATPGVLGDAATNECVTDLGTSEVPESATGYVVNSAESEAQFAVEEELASAGVTEAVGTTNAVIGTILVAEDGTPLACSRIDVDLRTLVTDESRRDRQIQNAIETDAFPLATFIVTEVQGLDGPLQDGVGTELTLVGNLTIHGVEKQVQWDATVTLADGTITGAATTRITFEDFSIDKPVMGPVMSINDEVDLTINLVAEAS